MINKQRGPRDTDTSQRSISKGDLGLSTPDSRLSASLPEVFFTHIMPKIQDIAELKVILYIFYLLGHKRRYPRFVTHGELLSLSSPIGVEEEALHHALSLAMEHSTILRGTVNIDGKPEEAYFINAESDKEVIAESNVIAVSRSTESFAACHSERSEESGGAQDKLREGEAKQSHQNIFALYEQNIGIITPMVAEELKEAERLYPSQWIDEAFREAVRMNKRSWKYIARILERWASEGKESGEHRKGTKEGGPDKYIRGKYGHLVKR